MRSTFLFSISLAFYPVAFFSMLCFSLCYLFISEYSPLTTNINPVNCAAVKNLDIEAEAHELKASKEAEIKQGKAGSTW